jgi:hypothetical protein
MCEIRCSHCQPRNAKNPIGLIDRNPKPQLLLEKDTPHVLALSHDNETHRRIGHSGHCCSHGIAFGPETRRASRKHDWLGSNQKSWIRLGARFEPRRVDGSYVSQSDSSSALVPRRVRQAPRNRITQNRDRFLKTYVKLAPVASIATPALGV